MPSDLDRQIERFAKKLGKIKSIEVPRANASALNKSAQRVKTRSVQSISKQTRVPQKDIRKRVAIGRATAKKQIAEVKSYVKPVPASALLTKAQIANKIGTGTNRQGVRAKGYQWKGAFINRGRNDNVHVFQRKGKARLPIEAVKIDIDKPARRIVKTVSRRVINSDYKRLLEQDLKFRLNKYGR